MQSKQQTKILIVKDERIVAKEIQITLKRLGYSAPAIAASGEEALQKIAEMQPNLVLMDINLGNGTSGIETAQKIHNNYNLPVIYLTAFADDKTLQKAKSTEAYGYIVKPFKERDLVSTIEMALYKYKTEKRITKLNECFLAFSLDHIKNIQTLVNTGAEILNGACFLYGRINQEKTDVVTIAINNQIDGFVPNGIFCYDAIKKNSKKQVVFENLINSDYYKTNPEFTKFGIKSYIGQPIIMNNEVIGIFCLLDTIERNFIKDEIEILSMLGKAISIEEERHQTNKHLQENEERFRSLTQNASDAIVALNSDSEILSWNKSAELIFGFTAKEAIGSMVNIIVPERHLYNKKTMKKIIKGIKSKTNSSIIEFICKKKDGTEFPVEASFATWESNGKNHYVVVIRDITERKQIQKIVADEKELLAITLNSIADGVITTDLSGKITLLNKVAENIIGWSTNNALGQVLTSVFNVLDCKMSKPLINLKNNIIEFEKINGLVNQAILQTSKNADLLISLHGAPIKDSRGTVCGIVLVFRDITQSKKVEQELEKASKIESIGFLAGGIAHDFNNILTAILSNVSLAKLKAIDNQEITPLLSEVEKASFRAKNLTKQLLTFSKGGEPIKEILSIGELIKDAANFALSGTNVQNKFQIENHLWSVNVDSGLIIQVIQNLVINAQQSMPLGGVISIICGNKIIDDISNLPLRKGTYIKLIIRDDGNGIPAKNFSKIFDPFFTTKRTGNGLGLATAYSIIKKHNGYIHLESKIDFGTVFYLYLPAVKTKLRIKTENEVVVIKGKGKILLMDDMEAILKVAGKFLSFLGYDVTTVKDGRQAIKLYKNAFEIGEPFESVILDLTIPGGLGGKETLRELQKINPAIKAIVSSGYSNDPIMAEFKKYGFSSVIAKPYKLEKMSQVLKNVLETA